MTINALILAVTGSVAASILAKVTVTTALALVGTRLARHSRASVRHVLLAAAFVILLALPIASLVAPTVSVAMPLAVQDAIAPLTVEPMVDATATVDSLSPQSPNPRTPESPNPALLPWPMLLLAGWAAGAVVCLIPVAAGLWQMRALRRSGQPWQQGVVVVGSLAREAGIHRRVTVLRHESIPGPMTCGVVRPAILLPEDAGVWAAEALNRAIVHELEHVRRGDWASLCSARIVCAVYWFHPLVWIARRQLVLEAERACDDAVLGRSDATAYADQLVVLAARLSTAVHPPQLAMANRHDLVTRVGAVLDRRQARGRAGRAAVVFSAAVAALLVTTISPLRMVAGAQTAAVNAQRFEVASVKPCAAEALPPTGAGARAAGPGNATTSPGRAHWECATLDQLVNTAYGTVDLRLLNSNGQPRPDDPKNVRGGPPWVYSDKFTIDAKAAGDADRATLIGPMLRALLEDRFEVKTHRATEERSMYALTVAKGALTIKPTAPGDCWVYSATRSTPPPGSEKLRACGSLNMDWNGGNRLLTATGTTLQEFARSLLSGLMDRYVINRTGVEGTFTIPLEFVPDDSTPGGLAALAWARREGATPGTGPSIFKALEALGLKLEPTKAPAEYLVIDHIVRPGPNAPSAAFGGEGR